MGLKEKKLLKKVLFIYFHFNYCPFALYFCSKSDIENKEKIQKHFFQIVSNGDSNAYINTEKLINLCNSGKTLAKAKVADI